MKPTKVYHPAPAPHPVNENVPHNGHRLVSPAPVVANQSSPRQPPTLQTAIRHLLRLAEHQNEKAPLLDLSAHPRLIPILNAAVADASLRTGVAHIFSFLSVENDAAGLLSRPPFLSLLDRLLTTPAPHAALRHASRTVRHVTAHSPQYAHALARNSNVVRNIIAVLRVPGQPDVDTSEMAAALANFARCGLQCQAYARKHGSLSALVDAAMNPGDETRFHACRALAEYSLEHKWLVLLVAEGGVGIMIRVLERDADEEIVSEATRFLGNLATSKVGREAVLGSGGVERVIARVLSLSESSQFLDLRTDLLRTAANLCVNSKDASAKVIALGGLSAFIDAYTLTKHANIQTEAFRGLLIIAQATHSSRASVLREVGIKIRDDASLGRCVASLYDLSRRIRVEASAERNDDFPQTIADLGARSKQYLFKAGPLAPPGEDNSANSVPGMTSPSAAAFRQSGRLLSVQRPVLHRDRLVRERRERLAYAADSSLSGSASTDVLGAEATPRNMTPTPHRKTGEEQAIVPAGRVSDRGPRGGSGTSQDAGPRAVSEPGWAQSPQQMDSIPRCKVIEASKTGEDSATQWAKAVWFAVCSAVTRPNAPSSSPSPMISPNRGGGRVAVREENVDQENDVYEIGVPLGRGGFATVYLAKNIRTEDLVAVKRFHPSNASSHDAKRKAELSLRRAIKEQRIWDGLTHKNIVSYKGCFFGEQGELNLVAEYIPGWSLADHLSQITRFPEHMVACITLQIVAGLDYLHKNGVTHRDVKPANILVNPDGVIKITDFGVSSAVDVPTMTGNTLVGTPWYIAPEMIEGRPYGKSVDIWSLGCTVMELATGKRPYHHLRPHIAMFRMTQDRMPPLPSKMSPVLRNFLKTCWVWDPAQRPTPAHLRRHPFLASVSRPEITNLKNMTRKA